MNIECQLCVGTILGAGNTAVNMSNDLALLGLASSGSIASHGKAALEGWEGKRFFGAVGVAKTG